MDQQQIMKIQMMEQESMQYQEHMKLIEQNIKEMQELKQSLEEIEKSDQEILTNIGKRIYLPVNIKEKRLIVEVGNGHYVKKDVPETIQIIEKQTEKLVAAKGDVMKHLDGIQENMKKMLEDFEKQPKDDKKEEPSEKEEK